jgi:hypothetical protein
MSDEPHAREEPRGRAVKRALMRRVRDWWWGRPAEHPNWEEPTWRITVYPPGPGVKFAELARYFRERWKKFVFYVAVAIVAGLALTLVGLN